MTNKPKTILDIGTGTGLLSLMIAQQSNADIAAIETDKDAFEQAKENILTSSWNDRIKIFFGDARSYSFPIRYDFIISNPPFYENEVISEDAKRNIALHNEGLLLNELLDIVETNLKPGGSFYILLPYKRNNEAEKLLQQKGLVIRQKVFVKQSVNHDYFRIMLAGARQPANKELSINEISIWDDKQQYTEEFRELLKDYYLYL